MGYMKCDNIIKYVYEMKNMYVHVRKTVYSSATVSYQFQGKRCNNNAIKCTDSVDYTFPSCYDGKSRFSRYRSW